MIPFQFVFVAVEANFLPKDGSQSQLFIKVCFIRQDLIQEILNKKGLKKQGLLVTFNVKSSSKKKPYDIT